MTNRLNRSPVIKAPNNPKVATIRTGWARVSVVSPWASGRRATRVTNKSSACSMMNSAPNRSTTKTIPNGAAQLPNVCTRTSPSPQRAMMVDAQITIMAEANNETRLDWAAAGRHKKSRQAIASGIMKNRARLMIQPRLSDRVRPSPRRHPHRDQERALHPCVYRVWPAQPWLQKGRWSSPSR